MTPQQKASKLYTDAYTRWCYELSHEKNVATAKDISLYICDLMWYHVVGEYGDYGYWDEVIRIIKESNHNELYKTYEQ